MNRLLLLYLTFVTATGVAVAQERDSLIRASYELNEIVVRPFKQEKALTELPVSATRISGVTVRNQQWLSTKDISAVVPNLFIPDYGSKYTSPVFIRGIGSRNGSPSVGLYVDGIPYFEKSAFDFDLSEVESIEVLRGPQGTLYGRNTMGGLIRITTSSPLKHERTSLSLDGGAYGHYMVTASHARKLSSKVGYSLTGKYQREGGYFDNVFKGNKADRSQSGNVRARLEWQMQPKLKFSLSSMIDHSVQGANAYAPYDTETRELGDIAFNGLSKYTRTLSTTGIGLDYRGKRLQVSYQHAFQYARDRLLQDQDFTVANRVNSQMGLEQFMTSGELNVKNQLGRHYRGLTGAFGFYQHLDKDLATLYQSFTNYKNDVLPTTGIALYHQSVIDHIGLAGLSLTLGLRYDYERATRDFSSWKNENHPDRQHMRQHFSQWVPKVSVQYLFPNRGLMYASVSKGYKTGGFNTSFNQEHEKYFSPESSWNYELGIKHPFWDQKFSAEAALFWIDWTDQQVQQKVDAGGFMTRNAGKSVSKGAEFSMQCKPLSGLSVQINYGYTHAKFKRYRQSSQTDYAGNYIPLVPSHTLGGNVQYVQSLRGTFIDRFQIGLNFTGNGKTYWHENNKDYQKFYAVLNATASVSHKKLTWGVWAKNLTQTDYIAYLFKTSSGSFAQPGKPFTIGASLSLKL